MTKLLFLSLIFFNACQARMGSDAGLEAAKTLAGPLKDLIKILGDASKNFGINSAEKVGATATVLAQSLKDTSSSMTQATQKITRVGWAGIVVTGTYVVSHITFGFMDRYRNKKVVLEKKRQEHDLLVAKQILLNTLIKTSKEKIGLFGLPEGCQETASRLLAMSDGKKALEEIIELFYKTKPNTPMRNS